MEYFRRLLTRLHLRARAAVPPLFLAGREAECQMIQDTLDHPEQDGVLFMLGNAGMGKSEMLGEAARRARARGWVMAFRPFLRQPISIDSLVEMTTNDRNQAMEQLAALRETVGKMGRGLRKSGFTVGADVSVAGVQAGVSLGVNRDDRSTLIQDPAYEIARNIQIMGQMAAEKGRGVIILYDQVDKGVLDQQGADALKLLTEIIQAGQKRGLPIAAAFTAEKSFLDRWSRWEGVGQTEVRWCMLGSLGPAAIGDMLKHVGLDGVVDANELEEETSGNPLLVHRWCVAIQSLGRGCKRPELKELVRVMQGVLEQSVAEQVGGVLAYRQLGGKLHGPKARQMTQIMAGKAQALAQESRVLEGVVQAQGIRLQEERTV